MRDMAIAVLLLASTHVMAAWTVVSDTGLSTRYVDPSTIKRVAKTDKSAKDEDIRQATEMIGFKHKGPDGTASYVSEGQYDRKTNKVRFVKGAAYSGHKGSGRVLQPITPSDWPPRPETVPASPIATFICSRDLPP